MAKMYYAKDCDINYLNGKKIAIIGYGSQGHAHAMNLKDSGCDVCVGLREGSKNWKNAEEAGLKVMSISEAAKWGDIVMMLINDEVQADVYKKDIAPNLEEGNLLMFAHGFNGTLKECDEGVLEWIPRKKLLELPHWEGDAIFLDLIAQEDTPFFSLKLCYRGEELTQAVLNGTYIKGGPSL